MMNPSMFICCNWRILAGPGETHQKNGQFLDLTRHGEALVMQPTHMPGERE